MFRDKLNDYIYSCLQSIRKRETNDHCYELLLFFFSSFNLIDEKTHLIDLTVFFSFMKGDQFVMAIYVGKNGYDV